MDPRLIEDLDVMPQATSTTSYLQEQQELWSLAWMNYEPVEQKINNLTSRKKTFSAEICRECYNSMFPETFITGKSKYIKFHRCLEDNLDIFEAISTGKCRCHHVENNILLQPSRIVTFLPACTAAVSGNLPMLKYLTKTTFGQKCTKVKTIAGTIPKGCLKSPQTEGSKEVNFLEGHAEILEETALGEILLHALYGGNEECIHFVINKLKISCLTPRDILAALDMSLRVERDDLFLKIVDIFGHQVVTWSDRIATPLILAASFGHIYLVETLLSMGANPLGRNSEGDTAVEFALCSELSNGETIALRVLSQIQTCDLEDNFMVMALKRSKFRVIKFLLDRGITQIEIWQKPKRIKIPLIHWTLQFMYGPKLYRVIEFLINNNQDCRTAIGIKNETPLHLMFQNYIQGPLCDLLLSENTSVNILDSEGNTPLYLALRKHYYVAAVKLLETGASLYCGDCVRTEGSIFKMALLTKNYAVLQMLLLAGYRCSKADVERLKKEEIHLPVNLVVNIAKLRGETLPLTTLCAFSLRESLQDHLSRYMKYMGTPKMVVDFVNLKHLTERFLGVHDKT